MHYIDEGPLDGLEDLNDEIMYDPMNDLYTVMDDDGNAIGTIEDDGTVLDLEGEMIGDVDLETGDVTIISPSDDLATAAEMLNAGEALPEYDTLAVGIEDWTSGGASTEQMELLKEACDTAPADAPELYRGIVLAESAGFTREEALAVKAGIVEGAIIDVDRSQPIGSWSSDRHVANQFAGLDDMGGPISETPSGQYPSDDDERVVFVMEPGAQALNVEPNANETWKWEKEYVQAQPVEVQRVEHQGPTTIAYVKQAQ